MLPTQTINPHVLREFILVNEDILKRKFPERKNQLKVGRPRIGLRWVIVAICVFARVDQIVWRDLPSKLISCDFLIDEGYLCGIPSKSSLHRIWNETRVGNFETWICKLGNEISQFDNLDLAVDSSGFEYQIGSIWRWVKWNLKMLTKTSKLFRKVHIAVALPGRAIVGIKSTKSLVHDAKGFGPLWLSLPKHMICRIKRVHADKAYWSENIINYLDKEDISAVIPCKSNSIDHGTSSPMDQLVRLQKNYPGIYKINYKTNRRASVEHVFGNIKIRKPVLRDRKMQNKVKTLLCSFLWYNHKLRVKELIY
ncbi:MAG: hypothetical protein HeimC2_45990 [Candidatus Heimdallarchaeota archaeon LC_2]|nr:MAG: hypothetical protein HeimC2_45990 [Candidatus Heimdallarchaeota archaeon LC_2]